ncbi:MAG TPA: DinB family protein [Thermoanaerobaculia bacterium]|nr:DinB family protein [Thermoanaerobaculia bacterium]
MNAYRERILSLLGRDSPYEVLERTPARLASLVDALGETGLNRSFDKGKWTGRQVVAHLADVEIGVGFRIRQVVSEKDHIIQPFDQDAWARPYRLLDPRIASRALAALRPWNLSYFGALAPADLARVAMHPERGEESVETMIRMLAGHDRNHLAQLERILAQTT